MSEYIDREAAIKAICEYCSCEQICVRVAEQCGEDDCWVMDALKATPNADVRPVRWISVTERLPEDRQNCLCYSSLGTIRVLCFAKNLRQVDKYDFADKKRPGWFFNDSEWGYCEALGITHWMPLPAPPKEEETE